MGNGPRPREVPVTMRALLGAALLFLGGCIHIHHDRPPRHRGGAGLEPGDRVLARWHEAFFEATVIDVDGRLVTVGWDAPPPEHSELPVDFVVKPGGPAPRAGEAGLCPEGASWIPCRVLRADDKGFTALRVDGRTATLAPGLLPAVPAGLSGWALKTVEAGAERVRLTEQLKRAVPAAVGAHLTVGQLVLGLWTDGAWWEATVSSIDAGGVNLTWVDGGTQRLSARELAPLGGAVPQAGQVAICREGSSTRWTPALVSGVTAADGLAIRRADGAALDVRSADCVVAK